jgi:catechol-2,3-dioxygenase
MSPEERRAKLATTRGRIAPMKLAHVVRRTARFEEMVAWYETVLAARVAHSDGVLAFLTYDDEHHRIAIARIPGLEDMPQTAAGTDHIAFTHADLGDLLNTYARLKGEGIEPYWCLNHGPTTSMYYKDPDANRVELQIDNFDTAETNRWMASGEFAENPIGVIFEPDELLERYRAGEPLATLLRRPPLPEGATPFDMLRF